MATQQKLSNQLFISQIDDALGRSDLPKSEITELIKMAKARLQCDAACQKRKKIDELKDIWNKAQNSYDDLPKNISIHEQAYYNAAKGPSYYADNILTPKYDQQSKTFAANERKIFSSVTKVLNTLLTSYNGDTIALTRLEELYEDLKKKNDALKKDSDIDYKNALTAERRVYYEIDEVNYLQYYNSVLMVIYFVMLGVLLVLYLIFGTFFKKSEYKTFSFWIYLGISIGLPFIVKYIVNFFYNLYI